MAMKYQWIAFMAVAGYFVGAVYWDFIGSLNLYTFVFSAIALGVIAVALALVKKYMWAAFFGAALLAMFTATYWLIGLF